jgi:hypothetical protein
MIFETGAKYATVSIAFIFWRRVQFEEKAESPVHISVRLANVSTVGERSLTSERHEI